MLIWEILLAVAILTGIMAIIIFILVAITMNYAGDNDPLTPEEIEEIFKDDNYQF
jgi:uncharacterized protein YneF (UPF0154 family)